jgi:UDP-N-acetylmuramate--alanine ligase
MKIHFVGIGGIGTSALARYYLEKGHKISGSDLVSSEITACLKKKGAKLFIGKHNPKNLPQDTDLVIFSPAIPESNPELKKAKELKIKSLSYPQALGELTKKHFTIAVSGTHGKSTTTAMIALILIKAGLDPTVIIGTKLKEFGDSNCRVGKSRYLVIEADEWKASFLNYWPKIIVLTSIEREHMDFFKDLNHIREIYKEYIEHLPEKGVLIANKDYKEVYQISQKIEKSIDLEFYSLKQKDYNPPTTSSRPPVVGRAPAKKLKKLLKIPGEHNISNSLAALAVARILKIPDKVSFKALSEYKGTWRRFEIIQTKPFILISDYAHHPTKVRVTLKAAREKFPKKKIWCLYQPHQYQRTFYLWDDFIKVFKEAPIDKLIITDIFDVAGREKKEIKKKVNSKKLIEAINKPSAIYLPKEKIIDFLKKNLKGGEVVIIMGAGDIYKLNLKLES